MSSAPVAGYRAVRTIRDVTRHRITLADAADGARVVLKQLRAERASAGAHFRLQREHALIQAIQSRFVARPIAWFADAPEPTLVLP